jgi:uncharacterized protein
MFIDVQDLERQPMDFDQEFKPGTLDLDAEFRQISSLHVRGRAQLVEEHHHKKQIIKDIRLNGELAAQLEIACARCLAPSPQEVQRNFDLLYRPLGVDAGREEMSVTGAEAEISYYQGEGLLLEDVVREQILLAVPIKAICRQDCKGLCPHCGANLNFATCSCAEPVEDSRWSALKEFRSKLDHWNEK